MHLLTFEQLADRFQIGASTARDMCRRYHWPHVKLGRSVRFTEQQAERIAALHSYSPTSFELEEARGLVSGLTPGSARAGARRRARGGG